MLLIFLVPYALVTTGFLGWQLYHQGKQTFDPLERLPDPKPGDGGAKRIHPHAPLPAKLKTSLGHPLRVGDLEVTPLGVEKDPQGHLALHLKLRNVSQDIAFGPLLPQESYRFDQRQRTPDAGPYTFLDVGGGRRLYILDREWEKTPPRQRDKLFDGILQPGEQMTAKFRIGKDDKRAQWAVQAAPARLLWRVQLRRGLVAVHDTEVSATAVIGVEFSPRAIGNETGEVAASPDRGRSTR
jgi:hypothetical protein